MRPQTLSPARRTTRYSAAKAPLAFYYFVDLNDGRDVRIVGAIRDDLGPVGTVSLFEGFQRRRVDVAGGDELRRASRFATHKPLVDLVAQAGIAKPLFDQWHVARAVVVVSEPRAVIGRQ